MSMFSTRISAKGPQGNIFAVLGNAVSLMEQIGLPHDAIKALKEDVFASQSYEEAISFIEEYFPVDL